jgi:hypothetical protein
MLTEAVWRVVWWLSCREAGVVVVMQMDALFRLVYLPLLLIPNCPSIAGTLLFKCKGLVAVRQVVALVMLKSPLAVLEADVALPRAPTSGSNKFPPAFGSEGPQKGTNIPAKTTANLKSVLELHQRVCLVEQLHRIYPLYHINKLSSQFYAYS